MSTNLRTLKQAGKFARLPIFIMLCVAMLFSCIAPTFAVNTIPTASVTSTGGTLKDSVLGFKENGVYGGYIYIVEVSKEAEAVTIEIAGGFSQDVPYAITPLGDDDYDAPDLDTDDYSYDGNALTFTLKDVSYNSPVLIYDPPLAQETSFAKWMNYSFYMIRAFAANDDLIAILCYQAADANVDKSKLEEALDAVPTSGYYTSDDRYNGKTESKTGFWNEMQVIVDAAQAVYDNKSAAQGAVDAAAKTLDQKDPNSELSKAIANLIPTSQVNPTGLHETLPLYSDLDEKEYSTSSWAAFYRKRTDAQNLYDSLFTKDAEGNVIATEENSSAKHPQADVDALVKALEDAKAGLDTRVHSLLQAVTDNALAGISLYASYYDTLKETDYTLESWQNYVKVRGEALNTAKEHGTFTSTMGVEEVRIQAKAFNDLRSAYFSLVPNAAKITVHVSLADELAAKKATSIRKKLKMRTYTRTVDAGTTVADVMTSTYKDENVWWINSMSELMVYVNGTMCFSCQAGGIDYAEFDEYGKFLLHDNDKVTIVRVEMPGMVNISEDIWPMALERVPDQMRIHPSSNS